MAPKNGARFAVHVLATLLVVVMQCSSAARLGLMEPPPLIRLRRETPVKHKTQHLKPAIEIEPIPNQKSKVAMPHLSNADLTAYAAQAAVAIAARFDEFEPTLLASNG